jgi:hypothetical protein
MELHYDLMIPVLHTGIKNKMTEIGSLQQKVIVIAFARYYYKLWIDFYVAGTGIGENKMIIIK